MSFQNTTLATLQARLAEKYEAQPFWTADEARRAINEGLRVLNIITGVFRTAAPVALLSVPNDPFLPVGGNVMKVTQVRSVSSGKTLNMGSLAGFDAFLPNWEGQTTATAGVPSSPRFVAPVGLTEIAIWPADQMPNQSQLQVDGIVVASILVNPGDFLNLDDSLINDLLGYALHVLSFAKGIAALEATRPLYIAFLKTCAAKNAVFAASSLYRKLIGLDLLRFAKPIIDAGAAQAGQALVDAQEATVK